ncbi:MAG: hypothetical protein CM15mP120_08820 [Pseudomonadota bacterium]|nr:MAG: hypothetical protein CM15mP120_08820 [Pseudomonadota bacterium]
MQGPNLTTPLFGVVVRKRMGWAFKPCGAGALVGFHGRLADCGVCRDEHRRIGQIGLSKGADGDRGSRGTANEFNSRVDRA